MAFVIPVTLSALIPQKPHVKSALSEKAFALPATRVTASPQSLTDARSLTGAPTGDYERKLLTLGDEAQGAWIMHVDTRTGAPALWEGRGLPWIPGTANQVSGKDLGLAAETAGRQIPVALVAKLARDYMRRHADLFPARPDELELSVSASGPMLDYLYFLDFNWKYAGIPVESAHVIFRLNHGNLVQVGQENISDTIRSLRTTPDLTLDAAWERVAALIGGRHPTDQIYEPGRLMIQAVSTGDEGYGRGTSYRMVWVVAFHRTGEPGTWEARVDAHSGEIISFKDINEYGKARGGTYAAELPAPEVDRPLPFADCGGGVFTNSAGFFTGNNCTTTLNGTYARVTDTCGGISLATASGDLNLGMSGGYDCTTPGVGGTGNTHASRTQFYNLNRIKEKARAYLPANGWLNGQLNANVNLNQTCNAYWLSPNVNFFRSGGGCGNTGEVMGVSMHEWGHGMDSNDGNGGSPDRGTGETYGDMSAALQTHNSCIGNGFTGSNCQGYGDGCLSCTGVRDIDWAKHELNIPHIPEDMTSDVCVGCSVFACPASATYQGPCGLEGHCESLISSESVWDLANRDLVTWGLNTDTAWQTVDRYWYASRPTATAAFACPTITTTNGCGAGSLFSVFRVVDDADGNLTNGTPHASAIFNAFNRHRIACTTVTNTDQAGACPALGTPVVTATPTNNSVVLNWTAAVGAVSYNVLRNELGCSAGFTRIATVTAPTVTYTDNAVANGVNYSYRIQTVGASASCTGAMSNCESPVPLNCTPTAAPTGVGVVTGGTGQLVVSWTAVGGVSQYRIYRSQVSGGPWTQAGVVSSSLTSFTDSGLYSGVTYYYVVRAFAGCESVNSTQASATTTGSCNIPPTFAGIVSATNGLNASCQNTLTWAAGASNCGGTVSYSVYRSETANFTPAAGLLIASGLAVTTYTDTAATFNTPYYYLVKAVDSIGGATDSNTVIRSSVATGPGTPIYTQNFEAANDWTSSFGTPAATTGTFLRGDPTQQIGNFGMVSQPENDHTPGAGTQCLFTAVNTSPGVDDIDNGEVIATSPVFSAGTFPTVGLDLWRWWFNGENDDPTDYWFLEVSNNGGTSWTTIENIPGNGPNDKDGTNQTDWANVNVRLESFVPLSANMRIRGRAAEGPPSVSNGNDPGDLAEAALDDIVVTGYAACTVCTPTAAPTGVTATPNGANRIDVSWTAVGGATSYTVYRVRGACGSGYLPIASNITGTTYSDTTVAGSYAYAYVVRANNAADCQSVLSTCSSATATGVCNIAPTFAGATSVTSAGAATCGINVNWAAATATCTGATLSYNIHRSTSATFTPSAANRIAACRTGTTYLDSGAVAYDTRYYYIVRAEQASSPGSGPCGGNEDTNTVVRNTSAAGAVTPGATVFFNNFDGATGLNGWTTGFFAGDAVDWRGAQACTPTSSGANIFRWGGATCATTYTANKASLAEPPGNSPYGMRIREDATTTRLTFQHRWTFNANDGASLLMAVDPVATYYILPNTIFISGPPNGTTAAGNALGAGVPIWTTPNQATMSTTLVNLDAACSLISGKAGCAGDTIHLAFTGSSNGASNNTGWFMDDVRVTADQGSACSAAGCGMVVSVAPSGTSTVAAGQDILFSVSHTATNGGPYSYQWTQDGTDITNATSSVYAANRATAGSHTYNVKVTDGAGCTSVLDATASTGTWTGGSPAPKPVPDGLFVAGNPMRATKSGGNLALTWDGSTCAANNYSVFWGSISGGYTALTGGACAVGTSGTWTGAVPDGSWYVIVGTNGSQYSSFGRNSAGAEEVFTGASGICPAYTTQSTSATCP